MSIVPRPQDIRTAERRHHATHGTGRGPAVVALGGGHGLAANLRALRHLTDRITAVVTVADNGGSSGRIRHEMPVLPPGDLRMALSALCEDSDWGSIWRDVVQHRFTTSGELDGHALGNLLIVTLWQILQDPVAGLDQVGSLLGVRGRVLPMALEPLDIEAQVHGADGEPRLIRGQAEVATAGGRVDSVRLIPARPAVPPEVLEAIDAADWVIIGPGSWYTSVLPHLMIPEIADVLRDTSARRCITMNLETGRDETTDMGASDLLRVLLEHAPDTRFDALIADPTCLEDSVELAQYAAGRSIPTVLRQVSERRGVPRHDSVRLAAAYRDVFDGAIGDVNR
ncbi:MAG: uridine diphosphate-N-acetylglucosamine-binding protein YvcK [Brachybacterium sp.]|nr:uridine diphosphate-N-acetylglucosamine-binding protein YvcK [Brachybacterium sp.]